MGTGEVEIGDQATVVAFSDTSRLAINDEDGINGADYPTNILNVSNAKDSDSETTLVVNDVNGDEITTITVPANYNNFAITTGNYAGAITIDVLDASEEHLGSVTTTTSEGFAPVTVSVLDDADGDGLTDLEEDTLGTDALDPDSDDDGLNDGEEVNTYNTKPNDKDSDKDGLIDGAEVKTYKTNPNIGDSDKDGLADGVEVNTYKTNPNVGDSDKDGLSDGVEVNTYKTNPNVGDSDKDGLTDGEEVNTYETDPNIGDSDNDGLTDGEEVNTYETDPMNDDSDNDGIADGEEVENEKTLAYTGSSTHVGGVIGVITAALFVLFKRRG